MTDVIGRVTGRLPQVVRWKGEALRPHSHLGIAVYPDEATEPEPLIDRAQESITIASPDPVVFFDPQAHSAVLATHRLEIALRMAVQTEALQLHYQPVIDAETLEVRGFEALARWPQGPDGTPVAPAAFIPLVERIGLIGDRGDWVLRIAVIQTERWARAVDRQLHVSVNVFPLQLRRGGFAQDFLATLHRTAPAPRGNRIAVEVTENHLVDVPGPQAVLSELARGGIVLYMTDFGTGCANLVELQALPFAAVKIDQWFVRGLADSKRKSALVNSIIAMARALGLGTIAEGVETEQEFIRVRELGCQCMHGYWTGRPMSAPEAGPGCRRMKGPPADGWHRHARISARLYGYERNDGRAVPGSRRRRACRSRLRSFRSMHRSRDRKGSARHR